MAAFIVSGVASAWRTRSVAHAVPAAPARTARRVTGNGLESVIETSSTRFARSLPDFNPAIHPAMDPRVKPAGDGMFLRSIAQGHQKRDHVFDLFRGEHGLATKRGRHALESILPVIGRHDGIRIEAARVHDPQSQLAFGIAQSGTFEIRANGALEFLLGQRRGMA